MDRAGPPPPDVELDSFASSDVDSPGPRAPAAMIEVALATRNSASFLPETLDSLFGQTCRDFTIIVSDDGSADATLDIVERYRKLHPGRIRCVGSGERLGGPVANFSRLLDHLTADYAMLCDHDDVWLPNKIALSLAHMKRLEALHGSSTPLLVHTDLVVVGPDLELLSPSFFAYQRLDPAWNSLNALLTANTVTGCTAMINRALYVRARPIPREAVMHDHWLALVAAATGKIGCVEEATILYRQHGGNAIGAIPWCADTIRARVRETLFEDTKRRMLRRFCAQAGALLARCGEAMSPEQVRAASAFARLWSVNPWSRFALLWRHGLLVNGFVRNAALFVAVTASRPWGRKKRPKDTDGA